MKRETVETIAIFTPADGGYIVTFPSVPGLTFHTADQTAILEEIEDAYDLAVAKEAEARNDFVRWEDVRGKL
jgi:predicted RNase H-like HicB family nuclease